MLLLFFGSSPVDGTVAATEGADTSAASGAILVTGTATPSEGADTSTVSGVVNNRASAAATETPDTSTASGIVRVVGTSTATEGADTSTASGILRVIGTAAPTEGNDTATSLVMASFVSVGASDDDVTSIVPAMPSGIQTGDYLLFVIETRRLQAVNISSDGGNGWSELNSSPQDTGQDAELDGTRLTIYWSRYDGSQTSPTADSGGHIIGAIAAFRNVSATGDGISNEGGNKEVQIDFSLVAPGFTTLHQKCLVVISASISNGTGSDFGTWANADLANLTVRANYSTAISDTGRFTIVTGEKAAQGTFTDSTNTLTGFMTSKAYITAAFAPGTVAGAQGEILVTGTITVTEGADTGDASGTVLSSDRTGTIAVTEADDTCAATGTRSFQGTITVTEAADTSTASGTVILTGTTTNAETNDTSAASGIVLVTGTISQTEAADTSSIVALVRVTGTIARTEDADTANATGIVPIPITGTSTTTEAADTSSITALVIITGTSTQTEANDTLVASGFKLYVGTVSVTEAADTSSIAALVRVTGTISQTEASDTGAAAGVVFTPVTGTIAVTEQNDTAVIIGVRPIVGAPQKRGRRKARATIKTKPSWDLWSRLTIKTKVTGPAEEWIPTTLPGLNTRANVRVNQSEEGLDSLKVQPAYFLFGRVALRQWPSEDDGVHVNYRLGFPTIRPNVKGSGETLESVLHVSANVRDEFMEDVITLMSSIPTDAELLAESDDADLLMGEEEEVV